MRLPRWLRSTESIYNAGDARAPWIGKISWIRKWQPVLLFLPGKSHGQRSLAGYKRLGYD